MHCAKLAKTVLAITETAKGVSGKQVMERALSEGRVLITEERDFGELVYARGERGLGVPAAKKYAPTQANAYIITSAGRSYWKFRFTRINAGQQSNAGAIGRHP